MQTFVGEVVWAGWLELDDDFAQWAGLDEGMGCGDVFEGEVLLVEKRFQFACLNQCCCLG